MRLAPTLRCVDHDPIDPAPVTHEATAPRPPDLSILTEVESELADVQRALARLDEGSYGTCQACGAIIDDERLASEPATAFCGEHRPT